MTAPLPPLPPVPGDDWGGVPAGPSMLDVLTDEHHQLRLICADLYRGAGGRRRRRRLADVLTASIARHLSAEEQYLYPTVRAVLPDGDPIADHELVADREMLRTLRGLTATEVTGAAYDRLVRRLRGQLSRHAGTAAGQIFPRLRAVCPETDLVRLGNRVEIAEEAAPTRPHPYAPSRPPWNKVVDPALGVADKVRDVLSGRTTYPADL